MVNLKVANILEAIGLKITGGSPGTGKVLTSDASGNATWTTPAPDATAVHLTGNETVAGTKTFTSQINVNDANISAASGAGSQGLASRLYVQSRELNLITNGSGLMGNDYNFTAFVFDPVETFAGGGSFKNATFNTTVFSDELIPVNPSLTYKLNMMAKATVYAAGAHAYLGVACYDIDGNTVGPEYFMKFAGSTDTTLAAQLNPGDTTVTLTNGTGWTNNANAYNRNFLWWPYVNAKGYTHPNYTYSRNGSTNYSSNGTLGAWDTSGVSGNVITLRVPWAGPMLPAGTPVSNASKGNSYKYTAASNVEIPATWTAYSGSIGTFDTARINSNTLFPYGTAFVKLVFLLNRDVAGNTTNVGSLSFTENLVQDTIVDNVFDKAPSQNVVYGALVGKRDVATGTNQVYIRDGASVETTLPFSTALTNSSIPVRDASGRIKIGEPAAADDAATMAYADTKQPLDADLTTIAGLTPTTDNVIQSVAGAWASRTMAQLRTALALVKGDVGLDLVDNTPDADKPVSAVQQAVIDAKVANTIANGVTTVAPAQDAVFDALALKPNFAEIIAPIDPRSYVSGAVTGANQAWLFRVPHHQSGTISKIGVHVTVQAGNVCVGVYSNTGTGRSARPDTLVASSGSVACPAVGYAEISLGSSVVVNPGDWLAYAASSATTAIARQGGALQSEMGAGFSHYQVSAFPLPATATVGSPNFTASFILLGVA